jgi:hypothetical protein
MPGASPGNSTTAATLRACPPSIPNFGPRALGATPANQGSRCRAHSAMRVMPNRSHRHAPCAGPDRSRRENATPPARLTGRDLHGPA